MEDALLDYDHRFPPLTKWTKDNLISQVIGNPSQRVMSRAQQNEYQVLMNVHRKYCTFHVFLSKVEPRMSKLL